MEEKIINVRVDAQARDLLAEMAHADNRSMSGQLRFLIREAYIRYQKTAKVK